MRTHSAPDGRRKPDLADTAHLYGAFASRVIEDDDKHHEPARFVHGDDPPIANVVHVREVARVDLLADTEREDERACRPRQMTHIGYAYGLGSVLDADAVIGRGIMSPSTCTRPSKQDGRSRPARRATCIPQDRASAERLRLGLRHIRGV